MTPATPPSNTPAEPVGAGTTSTPSSSTTTPPSESGVSDAAPQADRG
jgi:hypothetical protein